MMFGGAMALGACSSSAKVASQLAPAPVQMAAAPHVSSIVLPIVEPAPAEVLPVIDPRGRIRKELLERAMAALDVHDKRITRRDRMYLVDFNKFSGEERLYEVDLEGGQVQAFRTCHGKGSDPSHTGFAQTFSDTPDSHKSSVGAFVTAGPNWGSEQGPNVLLDGMEITNFSARERAIIVHGADYAEPAFLAKEGKLGRSYGCFSTSHADLFTLRERMGEGRLLYALA